MKLAGPQFDQVEELTQAPSMHVSEDGKHTGEDSGQWGTLSEYNFVSPQSFSDSPPKSLTGTQQKTSE